MGEERKDNDSDDGDGEDDEVKDKAKQYVNSFTTKTYDEDSSSDEEDEPKLELLVSCAELAGIFDPLHDTQYPFVEVYADTQEIGETTVASNTFDGKASEESSTRPVWNQSFLVRPDGTRYYRFRVCIEYIVRQRKVVGEAGFAAADAWEAVGRQSGPVALNVQLIHKGVVSGILHLVLGRYKPRRAKQAAEAVQKSLEFYMQQAGAVDEKWKSFEWMQLLPAARTDWSILGWTRDSWEMNRPPESEFSAWADLTDEERFAAMRLGYDITQWDGVEQISNAAASIAAAQYNWYTWQPEDLIKLARNSSLHRAHPYIGRDLHSTNNPPPILDIFPEDASYRHEQMEKERVPKYEGQCDGFEQGEENEEKYEGALEEDDDAAPLYMLEDIWNQVVGGYSYDDEKVTATHDDDIVYLTISPDKVAPTYHQRPTMESQNPTYNPAAIPSAIPGPNHFLPSQTNTPLTVPHGDSSSQANLISQGRIIPASAIPSDASLQPSHFAQPFPEPRSSSQSEASQRPSQFVQPVSQQLPEPPSNVQVYPSSSMISQPSPQPMQPSSQPVAEGPHFAHPLADPRSSSQSEASRQSSQFVQPLSQQLAERPPNVEAYQSSSRQSQAPQQWMQPSPQPLADGPSSQLEGRYIPTSSIGTYVPPSSIRKQAFLQPSHHMKPLSQNLAGGSMEEGRYIPQSSIRSEASIQPSHHMKPLSQNLAGGSMEEGRYVPPSSIRNQTLSRSNFDPVPSALQTTPFEAQTPLSWSNFDPVPSALHTSPFEAQTQSLPWQSVAPMSSTFETAPLEARPSVSSSFNIPVQTAPRLVGTTPMSSSRAPPKVLTSLSQVPQQIVEESFGSVVDPRDTNLDTLA